MQKRLDELVEEFGRKFKELRYSDTVLDRYRSIFTELQAYASAIHIENYSIALGVENGEKPAVFSNGE